MIRIVNKYTYKPEPNEILVYVGRGSPLGNPYPITATATRDIVCDKYKDYFMDKVRSQDKVFLSELNRIMTLSKTKDVALQCFCYPKRCHAETILEFINFLNNKT